MECRQRLQQMTFDLDRSDQETFVSARDERHDLKLEIDHLKKFDRKIQTHKGRREKDLRRARRKLEKYRMFFKKRPEKEGEEMCEQGRPAKKRRENEESKSCHEEKEPQPSTSSTSSSQLSIDPCVCQYCGKLFSSMKARCAHMLVHRNNRRKQDVLQKNTYEAKVLKTFQCQKCDKIFMSIQSRSAHMKAHRYDDLEKQLAKTD